MPDMDVWDLLLLAVGSYLAITTLIGLMRAQRNVVLDEISSQAASEKHRQEQQKQKNR